MVEVKAHYAAIGDGDRCVREGLLLLQQLPVVEVAKSRRGKEPIPRCVGFRHSQADGSKGRHG